MEKWQLMKKMKIKRALTKNEKMLLFLLGVVIIFWAAFKFVITPQKERLQILTNQKYEYEEKISYMNTILKNERKIDDEWIRLHREKDMIINKYFSNLDQPQIIYLLNEVMISEELDVLDINFNKPSEEQLGDLIVSAMDITIPYIGSYNGLIDTINRVVSSPKKILISDLIIDKDRNDQLVGNMSLKIYSLEGITERDEDLTYIDLTTIGDKPNPFKSFDDYEKSKEENIIKEDESLTEDSNDIVVNNSNVNDYDKEVLEDFEDEDLYFIPSNRNIKGSLSKSSNSKSNQTSLRFEYNILALEDENRAYVDLTDKNIIIKYPPLSIGLWVHSYNYSPAILGIRLKGQAGEEIDVKLSEGISWTGWKYVEASPPQDLSLYPLQLDRIYLELYYNRDDYGVFIFDGLEANYPKDSIKTNERYTFYIVKKDDTLDSISMKNYGAVNKKNLIIKHNEIKSDKDIREGKILVIPRY